MGVSLIGLAITNTYLNDISVQRYAFFFNYVAMTAKKCDKRAKMHRFRELSTFYTWTAAEESQKVCTYSGAVRQSGWEWEKRSHDRFKGH